MLKRVTFLQIFLGLSSQAYYHKYAEISTLNLISIAPFGEPHTVTEVAAEKLRVPAKTGAYNNVDFS